MRRAQPWLGTIVEIDVDERDPRSAAVAIDAAFDRIRSIHHAMSFHDAGSDLSRLNRAAPWTQVEVTADTWAVLRTARTLHAGSAGLFDCAVAVPLMQAGLLPSVHRARTTGGTLADIELMGPGTVRKRAAVCLDLGGIAKGHAVDAAVRVLRGCGIVSGSVNAGGDLRVFGPAPRRIHVRDPRAPSRTIPLVDLHEAAVATSGGYFVARDSGAGRSALVNPFAQQCAPFDGAVSVIAPDCILADAMTKVVALSADARHPLLAAHGAQALWLTGGGARNRTPALLDVVGAVPQAKVRDIAPVDHRPR